MMKMMLRFSCVLGSLWLAGCATTTPDATTQNAVPDSANSLPSNASTTPSNPLTTTEIASDPSSTSSSSKLSPSEEIAMSGKTSSASVETASSETAKSSVSSQTLAADSKSKRPFTPEDQESSQKDSSNPLDDPHSPLAQRTIYFDFDSCYIRPKYEKMLNAHAAYLRHHKTDTILIEGHTDERGAPEYNKELGLRRAENVRNALRYRGVSEKQLKALSIGEIRPKNAAHSPKAWAENRRADLIYNNDKKETE